MKMRNLENKISRGKDLLFIFPFWASVRIVVVSSVQRQLV